MSRTNHGTNPRKSEYMRFKQIMCVGNLKIRVCLAVLYHKVTKDVEKPCSRPFGNAFPLGGYGNEHDMIVTHEMLRPTRRKKMSRTVCMGRIFSCAILLLCAACSREQEEVYQAADADPDEKLGWQGSEQVELADQHDGRYSVYKYKFNGKGLAYEMAYIRKYGLHYEESRGPDMSVNVHIEWPEEKSGLMKDALAKVRKTILWLNFVGVPFVCPYTSPESFGETEDTLRKRNKELWAKDGMDREIDEYGLQPSDWAYLLDDALSYETGQLPAKDDGRVTTESLELGLAEIKARAHSDYKCKPPEKLNVGWFHCCSQWTFEIDQHIDTPFGTTSRENPNWYERPVLCVWVDGYDNDGGQGCHARYYSKVFSLPEGRELGIEDYFAPDKLEVLATFVRKQFYGRDSDDEESAEESNRLLDLVGNEVSMLVSKESVKWTWTPYSICSGCCGAPWVFIKWDELKAFK